MTWRDDWGLAPRPVCRCEDCGTEIIRRHGPQRRCRTCGRMAEKAYQARYWIARKWIATVSSAVDEARA